MIKSKTTLFLLCLGLSFSACKTNRLDYYSNYQTERLLVDSVSILADIEFDKDELNALTEDEKNSYLILADSISTYVSNSLADKGYDISGVLRPSFNRIISSGLEIKSPRKHIFREEPVSKKRSTKRLSKKEKWFSLESYLVLDSCTQDSELIGMFPNYQDPPDTNIIISDQKNIKLFALVSFFNTSKLTEVQDAALTVVSIAAIAVMPVSVGGGVTISAGILPVAIDKINHIIRIWLIDRETGKIIWFDHCLREGIPDEFADIKESLQSILDDIPDRNKEGND